jgi:hypothetical protein
MTAGYGSTGTTANTAVLSRNPQRRIAASWEEPRIERLWIDVSAIEESSPLLTPRPSPWLKLFGSLDSLIRGETGTIESHLDRDYREPEYNFHRRLE